ncbi:MAG TPA: pitrilysin family protein [Candidatus Kapabacteria bacterium]|nr:pitrilysin family protein [Candidatus Kapabacteria bacterium]
MLKRTFCLLLLLAAAGAANAQLPHWTRFKLENGLEVLVVENHLTPIVTVEVAVKNGSFTESQEYNGLSHLYEHMFFTANERDTSEEDFLDRVDRLGIVYNGETHEENVQYYFTLPKKNLEEGIDFMAEAIMHPLFKQNEIDQQKAVVLAEFDRDEASPYFQYIRDISKALWGDNWIRKEALGQRDPIKAATREKMLAIKEKYYIPNNSLLIIAGDCRTEDVRSLVPKYFNSWKRGADPFVSDPLPEVTPLAKNIFVTDDVEAPTSTCLVRWQGPSIGVDDKATYAADVFSEIIRQDEHEFTKSLMESGVATAKNFWYYTQRFAGPIQADIYAPADRIKQAMKIFWEQVGKFTKPGYYSNDELETSKAQLRSRILFDSESLSEFSKTIAFWWASTGLDYYEGYLNNLSKVNRRDINEYLNKYVIGKPYVLGLSVSRMDAAKFNLVPADLTPDALSHDELPR